MLLVLISEAVNVLYMTGRVSEQLELYLTGVVFQINVPSVKFNGWYTAS